jgi:hypothetical protein
MRISDITGDDLLHKLASLRPKFASAAQEVYDGWVQGDDDEYCGGGICDGIADAIVGVIYNNIDGVEAGTCSSSVGEQHTFTVVHDDKSGFIVDIPYSVYESGAAYSWDKIDGVVFSAGDIVIDEIGLADAVGALDDC